VTTQQWQLVKELFEAALERDDEDPAAFLAEACPEDREVRDEVESLLAAHTHDSTFMSQPVGSLLGDTRPTLLTGQRLGNYEVIATLGKGGMGQVYLALDTRLGRKIALKLLPFSANT
jgi:serine/threonine protein kinase